MVEYSDHVRFHEAIKEGDYHRALGVPPDARRLQIDSAAARLELKMPEEAEKIFAIVRLLTRADDNPIYESLCDLKKKVFGQLTQQCGVDFSELFPECRRLAWNQCCNLFHFKLGHSYPTIGLRGTKSLISEGSKWIADFILAVFALSVAVTDREIHDGIAQRDLWVAKCKQCGSSKVIACRRKAHGRSHSFEKYEKSCSPQGLLNKYFDASQYEFLLPQCAFCGGSLSNPSKYYDTCTYAVPKDASRGMIITGDKTSDSDTPPAMIRRFAAPRPLSGLYEFHSAQAQGKDVTLSEIRSIIERQQATENSETEGKLWEDICGYIVFVIAVSAVLGVIILIKHGHNGKKTPSSPALPKSWYEEIKGRIMKLDMRMHWVEITSGQDPSDAKLQMLGKAAIADDYLEMADLYEIADTFSSLLGGDTRPSEYRKKAIEILEPLVANHPERPHYRRMLQRAQSGLNRDSMSPQEAKERAIVLLKQLIASNSEDSLYLQLLERAQRENNQVPKNVDN
ncbi:MAG: hypothetical protein JW829_05225 [Pirellulales bacterium]|nr:hypothetical protein [Pirellulales bacterium]